MALKDYFENTKGVGVIAASDKEGKVNAAVDARPHFLEDGTLAFRGVAYEKSCSLSR
jgi:hypothetical protein